MSDLPQGWSEKLLGALSLLRRGLTYSAEMLVEEGAGLPYVNMKSFKKGGGYNINGLKFFNGPYIKDDLAASNDLLIANTDVTLDGDIVGIPAYLPTHIRQNPVLFSHHVTRIKFVGSEITSHYLYYLLNIDEYRRWMHKYARGTTVMMLDMTAIKRIPIRYPTCENSQKVIVKKLEVCDEIIEKTEALIHKYQQIKAGLMHDLFTRGLTADGKLRSPREQAPELYQATPIGWIPKEWGWSIMKEKAFPGCQHLRTGPFGSALKGEHWVEDGHPVITIGALGEGDFISSELLYIGDSDANRLAVFRLKSGDVVFSRVADVGRSVVIKQDQAGWIMSSNLMRISLDRRQVIPAFLQYQLSSDSRIKIQIRCKVNAGGRDVANSDILNRLIFIWPKYEEQEAIVKRANTVDARLQTEKEKMNKLKKQKSGLMHDLLTGKVPVKIDQAEATHV